MMTTWSMSNADLRILADMMGDSDRIDVTLGECSMDFARRQVAAQVQARKEQEAIDEVFANAVRVHPPTDDHDPYEDPPPWHVIGDMRADDRLLVSNHELSAEVVNRGTDAGLSFESDPESSCSYFYCDNEETAQAVAKICRQVMAS